MNKEVQQLAIQTFSIVPEVYQEAFRNAGADFPDELVAAIKQDATKAEELLASDKNLLSAVVNIFQNNQDTIMKAAQQQTGMFKKGGKLAACVNKFQRGGLTRKQARQLAEMNKGIDSGTFRDAYANMKEMLRENSDLRGRQLRQQARRNVALNTPELQVIDDIAAPVAINTELVRPDDINFRGRQAEMDARRDADIRAAQEAERAAREAEARKRREAEVRRKRETERAAQETQREANEPAVDNTIRKRSGKDNWYQFQYEVDKYNRANNNYRPNQDSAAYQHWLWDEYQNYQRFPDQYIFNNPIQEQLAKYRGRGKFTHGTLPWSRKDREMYGVDYDNNQFDAIFDRYKTQNRGIPATDNLYNGMATAMGTAILAPFAADQLIGNAGEIYGYTKDGVRAAKNYVMRAADDMAQSGWPTLFKKGGLLRKNQKGGLVKKAQKGDIVEKLTASGSNFDTDSGRVTYDITINPEKQDTTVSYSYPSYNGEAKLTPNGATTTEWLNGDIFGTKYRDTNWVKRHPRRWGWLPFQGRVNNEKIRNVRELVLNHVDELK